MSVMDVIRSERRHLESDCCPTCGQRLPDRGLRVDVIANTVTANGLAVTLCPMEADMLGALAAIMPRVGTRDYLMESIDFLTEPADDKVIKVLVCHLRPKIWPIGLVIETVWSRGYRLAIDPDHPASNPSSNRERELA